MKAKFHHPESNDVDDDIRPWLAQWSLWSALELISRDIVQKIFQKRLSREDSTEEKIDDAVEKFRLYFVETRDDFWSSLWYPVDDRQDVHVNIKRAKRIVFRFFIWHLQAEKAPSCFQMWREVDDEFSMYTKKDTFSRDLDAISDWEILNCPWWIEQRLENPKFVADAETLCWEKVQKEEEPFDVSKDKFEDSDKKEQLEEARHLEPTPNIDGLVVDTSRTKKQREAKMKNPRSEDVEEADGQTPKGKSKPAKNPGSGKRRVRFLIFLSCWRVPPEGEHSHLALLRFFRDILGRSSKTKKAKEKENEPSKKTTKEVTKEKGRKKKDQSEDEAEKGSQEPASNDAMEHQPDSATPVAEEDQQEPTAAARKEGRQRKRAKKLSDGLRLYDGLFRADQYVDIPNQFVVLKSSLKSTIETIQANKNRTKKLPVPIIDELKKTCTAVGPMRMSGFLLNGKQSSFAADCLYLDLPSGLNLEVDDKGPPLWNVYPTDDDLPRKLMALGPSLISKAEVFCKWGADFQIPKAAGPPFDVDNSGKESALMNNYNTIAPKKLDDLGRRKCTGFVQTLLEDFTKHGDIVIDFAGGWGASLQAAFNCSRCCIVAEERQEAYDNLQLTLATIAKAKDNLTPESSSQPVPQTDVGTSRGKKPLGED
ncbi:hypothetical protein R1sor_027270 [Riccia sorocarpa]|uniref:Trimethylguanosine synthase n=1 Tax=Riccia sorocarpa TaxID=122646 RepID=A0ABD3GFG4_9MARC